MSKVYIDFDRQSGYPRGVGVYYECQKCKTLLDSMSKENANCACYNIGIDVDAGRLAVLDDSLVKVVHYEEDVN